jgi:hypothetical protein
MEQTFMVDSSKGPNAQQQFWVLFFCRVRCSAHSICWAMKALTKLNFYAPLTKPLATQVRLRHVLNALQRAQYLLRNESSN